MELDIETWRPLTSAEQISWDYLSSQDKETCDALVHRLHRELGHFDFQEMLGSLRQRKVHPTLLAGAKFLKCGACQASARLSLRPVASGRLAELGAVLQMDSFY